MRITGLKTYPLRIPCRQEIPFFVTSLETMRTIDFIIIELITNEGIKGIGEASTIDTWSEGQHASVHVLNNILLPVIINDDPFNVEKINSKMDAVIRGYSAAKAAVDMALYDIQGKTLGVPVYKLLGGKVREHVTISRSVGICSIDAMVRWACAHVDLGSKTIKLKTGLDLEHDIRAMEAVRKAVGSDIAIKIDANQGYREPKTAIKTIKRMEQYGLSLAEQPVLGWDLDGMAQVRASVDTPIVADESIWGLEDIQHVIEKKAADVFCIYLMKSGGITKNKKVAHVAESRAIPCILGGMGELGVGTAANLHFAASTTSIVYPCDLYVPPTLAESDVIKGFHHFDGDRVHIPETPGLGIELDYDKLEHYGRRVN